MPADTTPTIYCTETSSIIDTCLPGQDDPEAKLARLRPEYGQHLIVLPFDEAWSRHETAAKTDPVEITPERYLDALNVLPPVSWRNDGPAESFKLSERLTGNITSIYVRLEDRYFSFNDDIRTPHTACVERVGNSPAFLHTSEKIDPETVLPEPEETPHGYAWPSSNER